MVALRCDCQWAHERRRRVVRWPPVLPSRHHRYWASLAQDDMAKMQLEASIFPRSTDRLVAKMAGSSWVIGAMSRMKILILSSFQSLKDYCCKGTSAVFQPRCWWWSICFVSDPVVHENKIRLLIARARADQTSVNEEYIVFSGASTMT